MNLVTCTNQEMSDITFKNNTGQYPSGSCITAASFSEIKLAQRLTFKNNNCINCESSIMF